MDAAEPDVAARGRALFEQLRAERHDSSPSDHTVVAPPLATGDTGPAAQSTNVEDGGVDLAAAPGGSDLHGPPTRRGDEPHGVDAPSDLVQPGELASPLSEPAMKPPGEAPDAAPETLSLIHI